VSLEVGRIVFSSSLVGEIGIIFDVQRTATVVAKTSCTLLTLTKEEVNQGLKNYPDVKKSMISAAQARIQSLLHEYERRGKHITDEMKTITEIGAKAVIFLDLGHFSIHKLTF
jgi:CRP-like cAMP-binding protein